VGTDGIARVVDFGLAKATARSQASRSGLRGKCAYVAPEQVRDGPVDRRADIFSTSIVLWEVLTGARLFSAEEPVASIARVLTEEIHPPSRRVPDLPPALDAIVMKGLERDPALRFATAREMAAAIEAAAPIARPIDVGAWVEATAGVLLHARAARIAEIEAAPAVRAPALHVEAPNEPTLQLRDVDEQPAVPAPRRKWRWVALAGIGLAGVVAALVSSRLVAARRVAPAPPAESATPAPLASAPAPVEAIPSPTPVTSTPSKSATRRPARRPDCDPPYYFDNEGVKRFKPKCI
jgi:serine/threonine-protein kinase